MKMQYYGAGVLFSLLLLVSCQQVFTYSPLSWAQRDPSTLSEAQKIVYAEEALASGDIAAVKAAYEALKASTDPDTQVLVSQLAMSASGINEAIADALSNQIFDASAVAGIDSTWLINAEASMYKADSGGADITSDEYLTVAAGLVVLAAQSNGNDISTLPFSSTTGDIDGTDLEKAVYYADAAGYTSADLESMLSF